MNVLQRVAKAIKSAITNKKGWFSDVGWVSLFGGSTAIDSKEMYTGLVFKCVDLIASNVSTNKFRLYKIKDNEKEVVTNHPAYKLLRKPNRFQTSADLLYLASTDIDLAGVSYLYPVKNIAGTGYVELWRLNPFRIKVVPSDTDYISHYEYMKPKGGVERFEVGELIEIKRPDPYNPIDGLSTIQKAKYEIENQLNAIKWNSQFFNQGAMPSGILTTEQQVDDDAFNRMDKQYRDKFQSVNNAHKLMFLDNGMKFESLTMKQKDMDFIQQREFSRDEILAMFGVPKGILYANDVNRANAEAAKFFLAEHTLSPRLDLIFEKLNVFFLSKFENGQDYEFGYDTPVPENLEYALNRKERAVNKWLTINEVRAEDGYEPLIGGDIFYMPSGMLPSGEDNDPKPPQTVQNVFTVRKRKSVTDSKYLKAKHSYLTKKEKEMITKLKAHFSKMIELFRNKTSSKSFIITTKSEVHEVVSKLVPDLKDWQTLTAKIIFDFGEDTLKTAINQTGEKYDLPIDFNLENSGAIRMLNKRAVQSAKSIVDTTLEQARDIIKQELEAGNVTLEKIKERLLDELNLDKTYRAERIARTELMTAYGEGANTLYKQSELVSKLKWITADDEKVCPICSQNDGQIIEKKGVFKSGNDRTPAHVNCRCDIVPLFD